MDEKRYKSIVLRHATPSRGAVSILVTQIQDAAGHWLVPVVTLSGPLQQIIESGRFARDVGIGLIVASYYFDIWMRDVDHE